MGFAKNKMMEIEERGWSSPVEKNVCYICLNDYSFSKFINENSDSEHCGYCGKSNSSILLENLMPKLKDGFDFLYSRAVDELGYDSREGGYQGVTYEDIGELVYNLLEGNNSDSLDEIISDISACFLTDIFCDNAPYGEKNDFSNEILSSWEEFSSRCKDGRITDDNISEVLIINGMMRFFEATGNLKTFNKNQLIIYRAHKKENGMLINAQGLGTMPLNMSIDKNRYNRYNKSKDPLFYGSNTKCTALLEINEPTDYIIGKFINCRQLILLDLAELKMISPFDVSNRDELYYSSHFIFNFQKEIAKSIDEDIAEIEYLPTQLMSQYLRIKYPQLGGIIYRSSKNPVDICYALYVSNEECSDSDEHPKTKLQLVSVE